MWIETKTGIRAPGLVHGLLTMLGNLLQVASLELSICTAGSVRPQISVGCNISFDVSGLVICIPC